MRVLVTGGTGLVGTATAHALLQHGAQVRILARGHTQDDTSQLPGVEFHRGDVSDPVSVRGAAEGCEVIAHLAGIMHEHPPEQTLQHVNVDGTRHILIEARRAHVRRVIYLSSLGAERGHSHYHLSKLRAEEAVRAFAGDWTILRPGNVYGPGEGLSALFLRLVRTLPVVPAIGNADQRFQPIWVGDLGEAIARVIAREDMAGRVLELAGLETTSQRELHDRFCTLTARTPALVSVPNALVSLGSRVLDVMHFSPPIIEDQLKMLEEGSVLLDNRTNVLRDQLGIEPLPLADGLALLVSATPEQLPSGGNGRLVRRRFWAEIVDSSLDPEAIIKLVQRDFQQLLPSAAAAVGTERLSPTELSLGAAISLSLPIRGNVQIRVEEITDHSITCCTLLGHPLAGAVRFLAEPRADRVRFEVQTYDRPANPVDQIAMATVGLSLKRLTWKRVVESVVERSGGAAPDGVQTESDRLDDAQVGHIEDWLRGLIERRTEDGAANGSPPTRVDGGKVAVGPGGEGDTP